MSFTLVSVQAAGVLAERRHSEAWTESSPNRTLPEVPSGSKTATRPLGLGLDHGDLGTTNMLSQLAQVCRRYKQGSMLLRPSGTAD